MDEADRRTQESLKFHLPKIYYPPKDWDADEIEQSHKISLLVMEREDLHLVLLQEENL